MALPAFLRSLKQDDVESSIELLIHLLKRRQIQNSRPCATATAHLLLRVVAAERTRDARELIRRVRAVGRRLVAAQPRELAVGNIVRRVLGVVREVADDDRAPTAPANPDLSITQRASSESPAQSSQPSSLFGLFERPSTTRAPKKTQASADLREKLDVKAEVIDGIKELLDELEVVDSQIAESALEHIHSNELILTHTSSQTVQKFLMAAARKRKFSVIHAEAYPNDHLVTHATIVNGSSKCAGDDDESEDRWKPLTAMGITVILIPDSAVFALMSRISKVIISPHSVLADGSLLAAAGANTVAQAAKAHHVPVVVLSGVYKLSPVYPFNADGLIDYQDPGKVVSYHDGEFTDKIDVINPVYDWVHSELVDLYITNLGGHAPSYLYRIVADHYRTEDYELGVEAVPTRRA